MPDDLVINDILTIPGDELEEAFSTAGGPGGQHANRAHSRVDLTWHVDGSSIDGESKQRIVARLGGSALTVTAADSRSQWRNRQLARQRLKDQVTELMKPEPPTRRPTRPSRAARQRRLDEKSRRSQTKQQRRQPEIE